jgi:hypothetical protein
LGLSPLRYFVVQGNSVGRSPDRIRSLLYFPAFDAIKIGIDSIGDDIGALGMHPSFTLVAHNPLLAVIGKVEVDLFAVETVELLFVLLQALTAEVLDIVLVVGVILGILVLRADLVAAYVGASVARFSWQRAAL